MFTRTKTTWTAANAVFLLCLGVGFAQGGGGHDEGAGNNLSFPVIWSDGATLTLRGVFGAPVFSGASVVDENMTVWYLQQDEGNAWQAESVVAIAPLDVDWIDWGDNLEAVNWYETSVVRVETVLYQDVVGMTAFQMAYLLGQGPSELWGTNTNQYLSTQATVYSGCARLTIQKLSKDRDDPTLNLAWDAPTGQWIGDASDPVFNSGVWESVEGPDSATHYSAEVNVPGKVIYGYNWKVKLTGEGVGDYRLTFSLDGVQCTLPLNTSFTGAQIVPFGEEEEEAELAEVSESEGTGGGGVAQLDEAQNLTWIDVRILSRSGGGGGGGGGHSGPAMDVDGNGTVDALTDGVLVLRYLFGFRGATLIEGALGTGATRSTATAVESYIAGMMSST